MSKTLKQVLALALAIVMVLSLAACGNKATEAETDSYTYHGYAAALGTNWNPHTWENSSDSDILSYVTTPLMDMSILDSENQIYQWVYEAASDIKDVTADHQDLLTKYATDNDGTATDGYVFEIDLRPEMKWADGTLINADTYVYSMQQLLDPSMLNYRANLYYSGETAIAGGKAYFYNGSEAFTGLDELGYTSAYEALGMSETEEEEAPAEEEAAEETTEEMPAEETTEEMPAEETAEEMPAEEAAEETAEEMPAEEAAEETAEEMPAEEAAEETAEEMPAEEAAEETAEEMPAEEAVEPDYTADEIYIDVYDFWNCDSSYTDADGNACPQYVSITDETVYGENVDDAFSGAELFADYGAYLSEEGGYLSDVGVMIAMDAATWDDVGLVKVDDYTILYVTQTHNDINVFYTAMTDNWIVYEPYYEANKVDNDGYVTTTYNSSAETTMSYGAYMIESMQEGRQIVYVQNPNWWNYQQNEDGTLVSYTQFDVDGAPVEQYKTTKIVIDVMDDNAAKLAFLKGELTDWTPTASELSTYSTSEQMYREDETYTIGYSFHTNLEDLQEMDASKGNTNSVVLSNDNFRKAISYALDRSTYVTATAGYKPAFYTMNNLYYYDVYNDPESQYRATDEAKTAIVNLYGVEYGEGQIYATLDEAYDSITGYNVTLAQELFTQACQELVADGLYTEGAPIVINLAMSAGEISDDQNKQVTLAEQMINAALEGTGFGTFTFQPVGNLDNRYAAVAAGEYAMNVGGWGGAAFYPYRNFQVYMDPDQYSITEAGCWDPTTETLTMEVNGEEVTMTYQEWAGCMVGSGVYAGADDATKLQITANLEYAWLNMYYFIPIYYTTSCSLLSYQCGYYTEDYNIMYGFGGLRLLQWNYNDAEWTEYVASQGGELDYE